MANQLQRSWAENLGQWKRVDYRGCPDQDNEKRKENSFCSTNSESLILSRHIQSLTCPDQGKNWKVVQAWILEQIK